MGSIDLCPSPKQGQGIYRLRGTHLVGSQSAFEAQRVAEAHVGRAEMSGPSHLPPFEKQWKGYASRHSLAIVHL